MDRPAQTLVETPLPASEQIAPAQAGKRGPARLLLLLFLAIIASVGLVQVVVELRRGERPGVLELFRQRPTAASLRGYEHRLEDASVLANALRPWGQYLQFRWFQDGGEKALFGVEGWLFYKPGLDDSLAQGKRSPAGGSREALASIVDFRDQLAARGIQLLLLPAPNKESVYPDKVTRRAAGLRSAPSPAMSELLKELRAAGVEVVNLFEAFAVARQQGGTSPLYLAQDSHWSPAGIDLAARAVAQRLVERGWVKPGSVEYEVQPAPIRRMGDVVRMLQVPQIERETAPESVAAVRVVRDGRPYRDDPDSEVLVLGDSFLRIFQHDEPVAAGFIAHLAKELKRPVTSVVSDGGASTLVRQELSRRAGLLRNKKVVIWEFVERDIRLGAEGWQIVPVTRSGRR